MAGRAYRVVIAGDDARVADYASSFEVFGDDVDGYSAEQWARFIFERAPRAWRWLLILGWRAVLRLRLGPGRSPDFVLGWKIVARTPSTLTLRARSTLVTADKVLYVHDGLLTVSTYVRYEVRSARIVWSAIKPIHHLIEPRLITRAASRAEAGGRLTDRHC